MDTTMVAHSPQQLLTDPVAQELLMSRVPARLAYDGPDGTPRVVPVWFHWTGEALVMASPADAPKVAALQRAPAVAVAIDAIDWPYHALTVRGTAEIALVEGVPPAYTAAACRYFGEEQGKAWSAQIGQLIPRWATVTVRPDWVNILDFQTRLPQAIAKRMPPA